MSPCRRSIEWCIVLLLSHAILTAATRLPKEKYMAATIPDSLRRNAHAVIRYDDLLFEVTSTRKAQQTIHRVVTILDAEGRSFGELVVPYDKFVHVDDLEMRLLDANGEEIRSLGRGNINDYAATPNYSLYEDSRVKVVTMYHGTYPYTIEYEIARNFDGYIGWPTWYPEESEASVEYARFRVRLQDGIPLRYWSKTERQPTIAVEGNNKEFTWLATGLRQFQREPVGPLIDEQYEYVRTAPTRFEIDGYDGDLESWNSLGRWYARLYQGRQVLPVGTQEEVDKLVADVNSPSERVRILYERLQSTTRYVSIQLGIGGWQPFDATFVSNRGYGDCKALSNYMVALLNHAGITAYPALIYGGALPITINPDFPCQLFNHVIVCVPLQPDTVWLECTSQTLPAGHLGKFTENRYALIVTEGGGVLARTPSSKSTDNIQVRNATVAFLNSGGAIAEITTAFTGNQHDRIRDRLATATPKEREEWLRENIAIPVFNVQHADFSTVDAKRSPAGFYVRLQLPRFASVAGTRLLFKPNLMEKRTYVPMALEHRKHPVVIPYPYLDIDTITYRLPEGYAVEAAPNPAKIKTDFAAYESSVTVKADGLLQYCRRLEVNSFELPPQKYDEYRRFLEYCVQADNASVALVKK